MGIGGLVSILCFGLFFWSRFLGGTAGWLEVTLFLVGIGFIACEIFVIPGFGIAGVSGGLLAFGALVMSLRRSGVSFSGEGMADLGSDVLTVAGAFLGFLIILVALSNYIGHVPGLSRLTLQPQAVAAAAVASDAVKDLPGWQRVEVGQSGMTVSALRPSGKMHVPDGDYVVDVVTEGDFVDENTSVRVVTKQGTRVVVRVV
ncbi:MAG: peptidase, partial [Planctomycetota bacterium]